jgi:hypothetical protein
MGDDSPASAAVPCTPTASASLPDSPKRPVAPAPMGRPSRRQDLTELRRARAADGAPPSPNADSLITSLAKCMRALGAGLCGSCAAACRYGAEASGRGLWQLAGAAERRGLLPNRYAVVITVALLVLTYQVGRALLRLAGG